MMPIKNIFTNFYLPCSKLLIEMHAEMMAERLFTKIPQIENNNYLILQDKTQKAFIICNKKLGYEKLTELIGQMFFGTNKYYG